MGGRGHESIAADLATKLRSVTQHFVSVCVGARGAKLRTRNSRCPHAHLGTPSRRLTSVQPGGAVSGSWQNAQSSYRIPPYERRPLFIQDCFPCILDPVAQLSNFPKQI